MKKSRRTECLYKGGQKRGVGALKRHRSKARGKPGFAGDVVRRKSPEMGRKKLTRAGVQTISATGYKKGVDKGGGVSPVKEERVSTKNQDRDTRSEQRKITQTTVGGEVVRRDVLGLGEGGFPSRPGGGEGPGNPGKGFPAWGVA